MIRRSTSRPAPVSSARNPTARVSSWFSRWPTGAGRSCCSIWRPALGLGRSSCAAERIDGRRIDDSRRAGAAAMNFASDNIAGISPEILAAIAAASTGTDTPYGGDALTASVAARCAEIFEHEVAVFPVTTGTAANALALASLMPPWGIVYCHEAAHILSDECGAPEFFGGGIRVSGI